MDLIKSKINEISTSVADRNNVYLIETVVRGHEAHRVIEIFFDAVDTLDAEKCASLSREIQEELEQQDLIKGQYRLEVSSPGVDRPLKYPGQYPKHLNRNFELIYKDADTEKKMKAKLRNIEGEEFYFETEKKDQLKINFNNIIKAKVIISFS
jgi:ribosome maturation factor RimP